MNLSILIPAKDEPNVYMVLEEIEKIFPEAETIVCSDKYGNGKGWAIRQAMLHCKGDVICFIDGDMDIHPRMIKRLLPFLEDYDIVIGKKQVRRLLSRRILTRLSRIYIRLMFGLCFDTQTGLKVFKKSAIPHWSSDSFAFDVEMLGRAHNHNFSIIEVPIEVTELGSSAKKMRLKNVWNALKESFKIWLVLRLK